MQVRVSDFTANNISNHIILMTAYSLIYTGHSRRMNFLVYAGVEENVVWTKTSEIPKSTAQRILQIQEHHLYHVKVVQCLLTRDFLTLCLGRTNKIHNFSIKFCDLMKDLAKSSLQEPTKFTQLEK